MKNKTLIFNSFCKINNSHSLTHSLVESLRKFLLVADLIVDGCNTYRQSQCSPQNNSNSQPEYTRFYQPVSTTLTLLPAIRSSLSGSYPLTCLAWQGLPEAETSASIALGVVESHKPHCHYKADDFQGGWGVKYEQLNKF